MSTRPTRPTLAHYRFQVQLASILYDILREANAAILEKIETDQSDLATDPCQIFTAEDLAHLASHLATYDTNFVAACSENANGGPVRH